MVADRLRREWARVAAALREEFGRPARNRRILHRLDSASPEELRRLGLTRADLREAAAPGVADAAAFLTARGAARRERSRQFSLRCGGTFQF